MPSERAPLIIFTLFLLFGLAFTVLNDTYIRRSHRKIIVLIVGLCISLIAQNYLEDQIAAGPPRWLERTLVSIYGYAVRPLIIVLICPIIAPKKKSYPAWILVGINAAVHLTALFSHLCFWIDESNHWRAGPLRYCCLVVSFLLLAYLMYLTILEHRRHAFIETAIPILSIVIILLSVWLDMETPDTRQPITYLTVAMSVSTVFYYIWLHLQFVREHEEDLKARQRIRIMMSQIQPHFLYNTLSTIQVLCHSDPEKAADITGEFSAYLRQNLTSLDEPGLIPFWKELEHTKAYVKIEETRFPNVHVKYDVQDSEFNLPPLTLQPMVENAIRHGVRIRDEGIVEVITRKQDNCHELVIRDNGVGFNPAKIELIDKSHIGVRNVRNRIESMCGGTLAVDSRLDKGTTITIHIPVTEKDREAEA